MHLRLLIPLLFASAFAAEPDFPLTADSQPQASVPKGEIIKGSYTARDGSVFPGTQRDYQIYLPAGHDKSKPAAFMVFQDGVIYQAPVVFDNLIAKKDIPPLIGIFIKPGVVPAANENALPRFNRSYEYDSITPTYSDFLIGEFLPAIEAKHSLKLSTDPNHAAISGNSSGGICAFMVAWHRPDRFRRVFTGVGTYVGIHGADQLPVLVRKFETKPLRIFLQSGTGDNNLYCGDWWMANQMMERSLTWAGYDVNHAWGEGGHNQKHASQIFPDVLRWLWRDWQTTMEVKANPKNESKWKGYEVVGDGELTAHKIPKSGTWHHLTANLQGDIFATRKDGPTPGVYQIEPKQEVVGDLTETLPARLDIGIRQWHPRGLAFDREGRLWVADGLNARHSPAPNSLPLELSSKMTDVIDLAFDFKGNCAWVGGSSLGWIDLSDANAEPQLFDVRALSAADQSLPHHIAWAPDNTFLFVSDPYRRCVSSWKLSKEGKPHAQAFFRLEWPESVNPYEENVGGLCVDTNGWLYVATSLGIQVLDQAGRVNFILPTPKPALDVCFGGKDLSELFIACGDTIYKRPTKAKGVVSGQQPPIKPPAPKL